jgi:outer membrane immunogenic protein
MNRLLAATAALLATVGVSSASAADLPVKAPPVALPVPYSWTGCYIGVEGGANVGGSSHLAQSGTFAGTPITDRFDLSGGLAGGTVGCNYQFSNIVIGVEGDASWTNKTGSTSDLAPFNTNAISATSEKWIDTVRGRIGIVWWDRFFLYGTAGGAWAGTEVNVSNPTVPFSVTDSQQRNGWVAGVGGEWAFWTGPWGSLTFKVEYLHADFGTSRYFVPPVVIGTHTVVSRDVTLTDDIVRAGLNWKFDWGGPVVARY